MIVARSEKGGDRIRVALIRRVSSPRSRNSRYSRIAGDVRGSVGDARQPPRVVPCEERLDPIRVRMRRVAIGVVGEVLERRVGVPQHPGRLAGRRVLDDPAGRRVGRLASDPGMPQRQGVDDTRGAALMEHHVLGSDAIQLLAGREPALFQTSRERVSRDDPCPLWLDPGPVDEVRHHIGERVEGRDRVILLAVGRAEGMDVAIVQPGQEGLAAGVDDASRRPGEAGDLGIGTDGQHTISADGDGLGDPGIAVDRDHLGVADDEVGCERLVPSDPRARGNDQTQRGEAGQQRARSHGALTLARRPSTRPAREIGRGP